MPSNHIYYTRSKKKQQEGEMAGEDVLERLRDAANKERHEEQDAIGTLVNLMNQW